MDGATMVRLLGLLLWVAACRSDAPPTFACACEVEESCSDCMTLIGECCYGDPGLPARDLGAPMAESLARRCEGDPACRACCNECAALTCEDLIAGNACPPIEPPEAEVTVTTNANAMTALAALPMTEASLAANPALVNANIGLLAFAIECALPDGESVPVSFKGKSVLLEGGQGFAPEWLDGPCDNTCQRWVTSCMGARTNNWNLTARIYLRTSDHDDRALGRDGDPSEPPPAGYVEEGAFYGNVFADPGQILSCRGGGRDPLYDTVRVCTHGDNHCGHVPVGPCLADDPSQPHACEGVDATGSLRGCHDRLSLPDGSWPAAATRFDEISTVFLPSTVFSAGLSATGTCDPGPAPGDPVVRPLPDGAANIGDPCVNNDDCHAADLVCRVVQGPGMCTRGCTNGALEDEEAECGASNTCLVHPDGTSLCVPACRAAVAGGSGCPPARVCTGYGLLLAEGDTPGCSNHCSLDSDCLPTQVCGRDGICAFPDYGGPIEDRLRDGAACSLDASLACRGQCIPYGYDGQGICGSLIDLGVTEDCPDRPNRVRPLNAPGDDLGICLFVRCSGDADCPDALTCDRNTGNCVW